MPKNGQVRPPSFHLRPAWPGRPVIAFARDLGDGDVIPAHHHDHAQLVYATTGLMRVGTAVGTWMVPPQFAVWIPAGIEHEITCLGRVALRTVYVHNAAATGVPPRCSVLSVSPLLRELVLAAFDLPRDYVPDSAPGRLARVLLDQVAATPGAELHLPAPRDRRLRAVAEALMADPGDRRTLEDWARIAGASPRTLARLFQGETGLSFGAWRQQVRLHEALARLAAGEAVTSVAYAVGYDSPSAFIAMFRDAMGVTPSRYAGRARMEVA